MKTYTKEDIYEGMMFRNMHGCGQLYKITNIKGIECIIEELQGNFINRSASVDNIVKYLNSGNYIKQEQEINYQIF